MYDRCIIKRAIPLVGLLFLVLGLGHSQSLGALSPVQTPTAAVPPTDPLKRSTPRSAIYSFLQSCHEGNLDIAAQYLDLRRIRSDQRASQGPQLAKDLCDILDRDTQFEVGRLSNQAEGNLVNGLPPDVVRLDSFEVNSQTLTLTMQRMPVGGLQAWLVSAESVTLIPRLVALNSESAIEKKLPAVLVTTKFVGTPLYVWLALLASAFIIILISRLLSKLFLLLLKPIARRLGKNLHEHRLESFAEPLRLLLAVSVFSAVIEAVGPSALIRDYLFKFMALLFIIGCASVITRIVDVISDTITSRLNPREKALSYSVLPLFVRSIKILVFALAVLSILSAWGYNTNTILAGLGVGGLAVALAAQKTIENLFGGVSVITDRPVLVGDFCRFGDQVGTIEDIGLRSTRIRTLDRTIVTIPNSVFSTMTLENFAKRDRMWFHPAISLGRNNTPEKIKGMMDAIVKVLEDHPMVDPTGVPLRFTKISKESFDLEVFSYVLTPDFDEFLKVQSDLLLQIVKAAAHLQVEFAVPLQETIYNHSSKQATPASSQVEDHAGIS